MTRRLLTPLLAAGLVVLVAAVPAAAAWVVAAAAGSVSATGTTLAAPTSPVSVVTQSSVTLSWTPPAAGAAPSGYTVVRTAPAPATTVCAATPATTCTDSGLSAATSYSYAITSVAGTWVSPTSLTASATTAPLSPSAFVVTVPAGATAGVPFAVGIQARLSDGNPDTGYTGVHALTFSGPGTIGAYSPVYPASGTFNAAGYASVTVTLYRAETVTLTVADGDPSRTGVSAPITVAPTAGVSMRFTSDAAGLVPACPAGSVVVGANGQRSWYVGVLDQYGNRAVQGTPQRRIALSVVSGNGNDPRPPNLSIGVGANPAVTSGGSKLQLLAARKGPTDTTYQAAVSQGGALPAITCTLRVS